MQTRALSGAISKPYSLADTTHALAVSDDQLLGIAHDATERILGLESTYKNKYFLYLMLGEASMYP